MGFKRFKLKSKIILLVAVIFILFLGFVSLWLIPTINGVIMDRTVAELENLVEVPLTVLEKYESLASDGTLTLEEAQERAKEEIRGYRFGSGDYFFLNSYAGQAVMHPISPNLEGTDMMGIEDSNGTRLFAEMINVAQNEGRGTVGYLWPKPGESVDSEKLSYVIGFDSWGWLVGTGVYIDHVRAVQGAMLRNVLIGVAALVTISIGLAIFMASSISKPIEKLNDAAKKIADGNMNVELETDGKDEVADVSRSFESIVTKIKSVIQSADDMETAIVYGKLDAQADARSFKGGWRQLIEGLNNVASTLENHIDKMPAVVMAMDTDLTVQYANQMAREITVLPKGKELGKHKCYDLIKAEDCHQKTCACAKAIRTGKVSTSETIGKPLGESMDIKYNGVPLTNKAGDIVGVFEIAMDQTQIKEAARQQEAAAKKQAEEAKIKEKQTNYQSNEVRKLISSLDKLAQGHLAINVKVDEGDEDTQAISMNFEKIYSSLETMVTAIKSYIDETSQILSALADKNLDVGIQREYLGDFAQMKKSINTFTDALNEIFIEMGASSQEIAAGSNEVSSISQSLSAGSTEQASSIEEITASMHEISDQTKRNAERATEAENLASRVREQAQSGQGQMNDMLQAMEAINKSSSEISNIIKVIDEIAFQTNILALNAAVEAARAGEHGKGFAVVAEEVRNLAARSAGAASETTQMIEDSIKKVADGAQIADQTAEALKEITSGVEKVNNIVKDITLASSEQAQAINQINEGVSQVSDVTQLNAETAQRGAAASEEMAAQADVLQDAVSSFKLRHTMKKGAGGIRYETISLDRDA